MIVMYIYHALIKSLSAHMIHINLNTIFYAHVSCSNAENESITSNVFFVCLLLLLLFCCFQCLYRLEGIGD